MVQKLSKILEYTKSYQSNFKHFSYLARHSYKTLPQKVMKQTKGQFSLFNVQSQKRRTCKGDAMEKRRVVIGFRNGCLISSVLWMIIGLLIIFLFF